MGGDPSQRGREAFVLDDRPLGDARRILGVRLMDERASRVPDRDAPVLVLMHRDLMAPQPAVLAGVLERVQDALVSTRTISASTRSLGRVKWLMAR